MAEERGFADRSHRGKLRLTGEQHAWFVDQILTQSFEDMAPGDARESAMLTVHGRMIGFFEFLKTEDALYAHYEEGLRERFPAELERYRFATRVEIEDVSDEFGLLLVVSDTDSGLDATWLRQATGSLGVPAHYVWIPKDEAAAATATLEEEGLQKLDETELERIRVSNGIPRWGFDMDEKTFPQEAGIEDRAVVFTKGCYLGQEAMAKIHFRGKVNRRLARLGGDGLDPGLELTESDKKAGTVTSVADGLGLGLIRYDVERGTLLDAGDRKVEVLS